MLSPGSELFFEKPTAATRHLHRGTVTHCALGEVTARFAKLAVVPAVGESIAAYFVVDSEFSTQTGQVHATRQLDSGAHEITIELVGAVCPCDQRASRRVSVGGNEVHADFDDEIGCRVVDISATGFSVLATERHVPGAIVEVALYVDGRRFTGRGAVKSVSTSRSGRSRCGIHVLATRNSSLSESMPTILAAVHAEQLQHQMT